LVGKGNTARWVGTGHTAAAFAHADVVGRAIHAWAVPTSALCHPTTWREGTTTLGDMEKDITLTK